MSQLDLALEAGVSARHLSFIETGRARPSAEMVRQLAEHLLDRLGRQAVVSGDPALFALHAELAAYPGGEPGHVPELEAGGIAVPLRLAAGNEELAFISTATTFGTATDVTVSELAIESFFPADETTARALQRRPRGG